MELMLPGFSVIHATLLNVVSVTDKCTAVSEANLVFEFSSNTVSNYENRKERLK